MKRSEIVNKINENKYVEKTKRGIFSLIFSRVGLFLFIILAQIMLMVFIYNRLKPNITLTIGGNVIIRVILMMVIINMNSVSSENKNSWLLLVAIFPIFGIILFALSHRSLGYRMEQQKVVDIYHESQKYVDDRSELYHHIKENECSFYPIANYLDKVGHFPAFKDTKSTYFKVGDDMFEAMLYDIRNAKEFIFMEFFIVDYGIMWGTLLEELVNKANEGVKVRLLLDGSNFITRLKPNFVEEVESLGIECRVFSKMYPIISTYLNNRDHRKIMVVDGKLAYTGGINLADEYINEYERFGHWKDCGVRVVGSAVNAFTILFLSIWDSTGDRVEDFSPYLKNYLCEEGRGTYIPFSDNPLDDEAVSKSILMDMIYSSKSYLYLMTPYLIIDDEIMNGFKLASYRGVDVRICVPHIPDKKIVFALTQDNYKELIEAGVRIIEYTPGFVHSKVWLSDGKVAMVGTVNLDYRSLFHNFECGVLMYDSEAIEQIEEDFKIFFQIGVEITKKEVKDIKLGYRIVGKLAKPFGVLM